jgi:glycosyltransferase involved in cell wall biosynthesis
LPHLIKSFSKFILQENPKDLHLVLTGNSTYGYSILEKLGIDKKVREKIVLAKSIANEDLASVYSNATCFFFMSLYEGFGLPALEAMQCGTPVVTSNATSLPEVVGDAGIMLSPNDEDGLCQTMLQIYNDQELRNKFSVLGLSRAKQFSWERCANEYVEVFKKITK